MRASLQRLSRSRLRWSSRERTSTEPAAGVTSAGGAAGAGARRPARRAAGRLLQQPVQRQAEQAGAGARVDHDLGDVGVDVAHGVEVEPVARHLRRLLVLAELRREASASPSACAITRDL